MPIAKFNFIPETQVDVEGPQITVNINCKDGTISFNADYVKEDNLIGKFAKFYYDVEKKAVGWKILEEHSLQGLSDYKKITNYRPGGTPTISIKKIIKQLGMLGQEKKYKYLKVEKYSIARLDGDIHYVELKEKNARPTTTKSRGSTTGVSDQIGTGENPGTVPN